MQKNVKTDEIYKKKIEVAKQLINDNNLKTHHGLNRALREKGYGGVVKGPYIKKLFPELAEAQPGSGAWLDTPKSKLTANIINRKSLYEKHEYKRISTRFSKKKTAKTGYRRNSFTNERNFK